MRSIHALALLVLLVTATAHAATYPLDPLDAAEIRQAVAILQASHDVPPGAAFSIVTLCEPPKAEVLAWHAGAPLHRLATVLLCDRPHNKTFRSVVDLTQRRVQSYQEVPGVQVAQLPDEEEAVGRLLRKDSRFIAAMKARGITNLDEVQYDTWVPGYREPSDGPSRRLGRVLFDYRGKKGINPYPQPIEGVVALVDLNQMKVLEVSDTGVRPVKGDDERYGTLVAPHVVAPNHQHWFNMRLDFDVDGTRNSVWEMNLHAAPPGPENPYHDAFMAEDTPLATPRQACRDLNLETQRSWLVVNPDVKNSLGQPTAFMLMPGTSSLPYVQPDSPIRRRAGFIDHAFWATPYDPSQMYGGGDFPNQRPTADGLPVWSQSDTSLDGKDVVVWYTFGITHIPRPEDYPVMAQTVAGFRLIPFGFFDHDPGLDVPPGR